MEKTNKDLRKAFFTALKPTTSVEQTVLKNRRTRQHIQHYATALLERAVDKEGKAVHRPPADCAQGELPRGPLTALLADSGADGMEEAKIRRDTAVTFLFAGHDTTANLMTWVCFELARNHTYQARFQAEVDQLFLRLQREGNREMELDDLRALTFVTRVIAETLRFWPSVPNGTIREVQFDDVIVGSDGKEAPLPKGTQVMIPALLLHMNTKLWGSDAHIFNPDRDFLPEELWFGKGFAAYAPQSFRYCPFTFGPRDCIGKTFAMMEARVILAHLFHRYTLTVAEPTMSEVLSLDDRKRLGANNGTYGPKNGMYLRFTARSPSPRL